jgi:hypothetical protein
MKEELYFASESIDGIKFDILISKIGVRKILINKKQNADVLTTAIQILPEDPKVVNVFKQLGEYFGRQ